MHFIDVPTEQTTAATDALVCLVAILLARSVAVTARRPDPTKGRIWSAVFALLALAAALGSVAHGFQMNASTNARLWMPLNLALGLGVALFVVGAVYDLRGFSLPRRLVPITLAVGVVFFGVTLVLPDSFLVFVVYEAVAMLFALAVYATLAVRGALHGAALMAAGVLVSIAAAAVQASGSVSFTLVWEFDHNGAFHLIQIVGLILLFYGLKAELCSRGTSSTH